MIHPSLKACETSKRWAQFDFFSGRDIFIGKEQKSVRETLASSMENPR